MTPSEQSVPYGFCQCGCGQETSIRNYAIKHKGISEGERARYIQGHTKKMNKGPQYIIEVRGYKTPCWIWQWKKDSDGYGITRGKGTRRAHRAFYEEKFGKIPEGLVPDHLCQQRSCVNPDHMEPVTGIENARRGKNCILSLPKAQQIRAAAKYMKQIEIARRYGVSPSQICSIVKGKIWKP